MSDSLVRVSRRAGWGARRPTPGARWCRSTPRRRVLGSTIEATMSPRAYRRPRLGPPPRSASVHAPSRSADQLSPFHIRPGRIAGPIRFPPENFKHSLTLFSKSFSSFPRSTCSLSVSHPYLALDGIYRPIRVAFPNNPTRRQRLVVRQGPGTTRLSPSPTPLSRGLGPSPPLRTLLQATIQMPWATDSQAGLFPVRSPLLRVSFRESFCVFTTKWARLRRTHTANGVVTTDDPLFIPIPWRNSRRGLFVLPRGERFPCHRDREGTGRNEATTPPPIDV
ncbi:hypothetical protein V6N13_080962 [Hibiscus sabdariffa]